MFCSNCGAQINDGAAFCSNCGASIGATPNAAPYDLQPAPTPVAAQPMKWFKFLIYFALFAGAALNALSGFRFLTGSLYGDEKELVYLIFSDLKTLDMIIGIGTLALAALGIFTRVRLAGYYKNGPKLLSLTYLGGAIVNVIYIIGVYVVLPEMVTELIDMSSAISSIVTSVAMIFVNKSYFAKRASLFVNE